MTAHQEVKKSLPKRAKGNGPIAGVVSCWGRWREAGPPLMRTNPPYLPMRRVGMYMWQHRVHGENPVPKVPPARKCQCRNGENAVVGHAKIDADE